MSYYADPIDTLPVIVTSDETIKNAKKCQAEYAAYSKLPEIPLTSKKVELYTSSWSSPYKDNSEYTNRVIYNFTQPDGKPIQQNVYFKAGFSNTTSKVYE